MALELIREELNGIMVFAPKVFQDSRGFFFESFHKNQLLEFGISDDFVQDNHSRSTKNTIRGMHLQYNKPQGKLLRVTQGTATFREIDVRPNSKYFGQFIEQELSEENKLMMWVPPGFANGFSADTDLVDVQYKCTEYWNPDSEITILFSDEEVSINWRINNPIVSAKDMLGITLNQYKQSEYFKLL